MSQVPVSPNKLAPHRAIKRAESPTIASFKELSTGNSEIKPVRVNRKRVYKSPILRILETLC